MGREVREIHRTAIQRFPPIFSRRASVQFSGPRQHNIHPAIRKPFDAFAAQTNSAALHAQSKLAASAGRAGSWILRVRMKAQLWGAENQAFHREIRCISSELQKGTPNYRSGPW